MPSVTPTNLAPLPRLFAYPQMLGLARSLVRPERGIPTLVSALVGLVLAWRGTGRPHRRGYLAEPLLAALLGRSRRPAAPTLHRRLGAFAATGIRAAVEVAYLAELPRRPGPVWAAVDAHRVPSWGRGQRARFAKGWSGNHSRRLRGYRLYLAVDTATGQVITSLLARGRARGETVRSTLAHSWWRRGWRMAGSASRTARVKSVCSTRRVGWCSRYSRSRTRHPGQRLSSPSRMVTGEWARSLRSPPSSLVRRARCSLWLPA